MATPTLRVGLDAVDFANLVRGDAVLAELAGVRVMIIFEDIGFGEMGAIIARAIVERQPIRTGEHACDR